MSILFEKMTAIADNIRLLLGLTDKLGLDAMTENLETANAEVESQKNIIEQLRSVISEKAGKPLGGSIDDLIDGSITEVVSNADIVREYAFYKNNYITKITLPNAITVKPDAFNGCTALETANLPSAKYIETQTFVDCSKLKTVNAPNTINVGQLAFRSCTALSNCDFGAANELGSSALRKCSSLETMILQNVGKIGDYAFYECTKLNLVDLRRNLTTDYSYNVVISAEAFYQCQVLTKLILRSETTPYTLINKNAFSNTPIESGTGYIYVPRALVDTYKTATNWTTYANQFRALEDYTVDGATTGELDESKI